MLFQSKFAAFRVVVRKELVKRHPVTGDVIETVPAVRAEFGKLGATYNYMNPETGELQQGAEITGHFFDTDEEARLQGWDEDTKAMVERRLLRQCEQWPESCWLIQREKAAAPAPWPTIDGQDADTVLKLAEVSGLVAETLAYERENAQRPAVLEALEAMLGGEQPVEAEPAPAAEEEPVLVGSPSLRTIQV